VTRADRVPHVELVRVRAILGRGALTETLRGDVRPRASDAAILTDVVVKRLHPNLADDQLAMRRVAEEARVLRRLQHAHIPRLLGLGDDAGLPFFAQERVDGGPLPAFVRLTPAEAVAIAVDVSAALAAAHEAGVVHRDVSARNVLVDTSGRAFLIDFGVARADDRPRLTRSGATLGTPAAMAPEQARGEEASASADVWALGSLLYGFLCGAHPLGITADDAPATRLDKARRATVRPMPLDLDGVDDALRAAVMAMLQSQADARPPDGRAAHALLAALRPPSPRTRAALAKRAVGAHAADNARGDTLDDVDG